MTGDWKPAVKLDRALPRPVRLTGAGKLLCLVSALLVAGGVWGGAGAVSADLRSDALRVAEARRMLVEGRETQAEVTGLRQSGGRYRHYEVAYLFAVDGQGYIAHNYIGWQHWKSLQVGSRMAVRYLVSDPTHVYPISDPPPRRPMDWFFPLVAGGGIAAIGVWPLLILGRQCRLLARGRCAQAVVTRCVETQARNGVSYNFYYEFPLKGGGTGQGSYDPAFRRLKPPAEGSAIWVVCDPKDPRRNVPYPMWLVEVGDY